MPALYLENIPEDLYEAIRLRAEENCSSIAAEVLAVLRDNIPTSEELKRRKQFLEGSLGLRSRGPLPDGPFPSCEEILRDDRDR